MKSLAQTVTPWDGVGGRKDGPRRQGRGEIAHPQAAIVHFFRKPRFI